MNFRMMVVLSAVGPAVCSNHCFVLNRHRLSLSLSPISLSWQLMASSYAFATLLTSDAYLPGALTLVSALRDLHPSPAITPEVDFQTVCIVTPETVDVSTIKVLRKAFDLVVGVEVLTQSDEKNLKLLGTFTHALSSNPATSLPTTRPVP